jgi:hypothetical protein
MVYEMDLKWLTIACGLFWDLKVCSDSALHGDRYL